MQQFFVKNNDSGHLILFLLGWGMDERPMMPLAGRSNILFLYNYTDLDFDFDFSAWPQIDLAAFSCGVFMAQFLKNRLPAVRRAVAVNGTLELFDEKKGLSAAMVDIFKGISEDNYMDFRKEYLLETPHELELFSQNQPLRTIEDSLAELEKLKEFDETLPKTGFHFDRALVGENDCILPPANQKRAWRGYPYEMIKGSHFGFYHFKSAAALFE